MARVRVQLLSNTFWLSETFFGLALYYGAISRMSVLVLHNI